MQHDSIAVVTSPISLTDGLQVSTLVLTVSFGQDRPTIRGVEST